MYPIAYGQPAPGPTMEQCLRVEVLVPSWFRKLSNWTPKSFQNLSQEASWRGLGGCLGGVLGGVLGPLGGSWDLFGGSWPQDGLKSRKCSKIPTLVPPTGGHVGTQNLSKSVPRAF